MSKGAHSKLNLIRHVGLFYGLKHIQSVRTVDSYFTISVGYNYSGENLLHAVTSKRTKPSLQHVAAALTACAHFITLLAKHSLFHMF